MIRVVVTGPESSGKTTLAEELSSFFRAPYIEEYAREYLDQLEQPYIQNDLDAIALGHERKILALEKELVIIDTDFIVMKVWSDYRYGEVSETIEELVNGDVFDLHILCTPDIPWEPDPLRENPDDREILFEKYVSLLQLHEKRYISVSGARESRLAASIDAIEKLRVK